MKTERSDWVFAALVAATLFAVYAASAPRTVMMEDDGLFVLASYYLGVAHPPGYPLHSMLGKLFTLLPFGSVAYRVHLLSAAFGALSCAALWLCARTLLESRLAATLAALALGLSPAFWSQSIVAEVYTLNTFFLFTLLVLALRGGPLELMALLFGLSLSNHWPLMLLAAPALALLVWPRRLEVRSRLPTILQSLLAGLLPYAWMVYVSQTPLPVSFSGPIGSWSEFWFFVSRAGYAEVDGSPTAGWLDRVQYFRFMAGQLLLEFAVVGTAFAAAGCCLQWRLWGRLRAAALTLAFVMPSFVLILMLGFDYDAFHKHIFHVYPLPAYGIAALWLALGFSTLASRFAWSQRARVAAGAVLVALVAAVGARGNLLSGYAWVERYALAVLEALPKDAIVLLKGADVGPLGYLHLVQGVRPDVTLYHPQGLVLGNRLFHPHRTGKAKQEAAVRAMIERASEPVAATAPPVPGFVWREHWLYATVDKAPAQPGSVTEIPASLVRFFEQDVRETPERNQFIAFYQGELRRRYVALAAQGGEVRQLESLARDFYGALGAVEGLLASRQGYPVKQALRFLDTAGERMPSDASKQQRARYLELRAYVRLELGDRRGAMEDLEAAWSTWPVAANGAAVAINRLRAL